MPRLTLETHTVRLTPREWSTLADLARLTQATPTRGTLAKELCQGSSSRDHTSRKVFSTLTTRGVSTRQGDGWVLPEKIRQQVTGLGLPSTPGKGGGREDPRQLRLV